MKLVNRVGDTLLAKLVPGIDARANCGQCRRYRCVGCGDRPDIYKAILFIDDCGKRCGPWEPCNRLSC
jgi:hypothetical protein